MSEDKSEQVDERREFPRAEVPVTVDVRVGEEILACFAADLSEGGVRLSDLHDVNAGDHVALLIQIDDEGETIEVGGEVKWTSDAPAGTICGIEFVNLADEAKARIRKLVEAKLEETLE